jgi:hypothetical protein
MNPRVSKVFVLITVVVLGVLCMAPNRRRFDHIGNFAFPVTPAGVAQGTMYFDAVNTTSEPACFPEITEAVRLRFPAPLTPIQVSALGNANAVVVSGQQLSVRFGGAVLEEYQAQSIFGPTALISYLSCE